MGRKKYFISITSDSTQDTLSAPCEASKNNLEKLQNLIPYKFQQLLHSEIYVTQLVYSNDNNCNNGKSCESLDIEWVLAGNATERLEVPSKTFETSERIGLALHKLSESMTRIGSYELTVFCEGPVFKTSPETHLILFSALLRLSHWCLADIRLSPLEKDLTPCGKWDRVIRGDGAFDAGEICLWKGSIKTTDQNWFTRLKLCFEFDKWNNYPFGHAESNLPEASEFCVSHRLELLDECTKISVPSYLIYPTKLKLKCFAPRGGKKIGEINPFIKHLQDKPKMGYVARIHYFPMEDVSGSPKLRMNDWNLAIVDDTYQACLTDKYTDPERVSYINVFIFAHDEREESLSAYILRNPAKFNTNFLKAVISTESKPPPEAKLNVISKIFQSMPHFTTAHWNSLVIRDPDHEFVIDKHPLKCYRYASVENSNRDGQSNATSCDKSNILNECDPCDWPERKYLATKTRSDESLTTISKTCESNVSLDICQLFDKNGNAKINNSQTTSPKKLSTSTKTATELQKLITSLPWPDVKNQVYHDVYYNDDKTEQVESIGMELRNKLVVEETSSKDFKQRTVQRAKVQSPRDSSRNKTNAIRRQSPRKKLSQSEECQKTGPSKKVSQIKERLSKPSPKHKSQLKIQPKPNSNAKCSFSIRVQTAKAVGVIDDRTKKKLREAVVTAFESRGIKMKDPLFELCGKRLFNICKEYAKDFVGPGVLARMKKVAEAHIDQVIELEQQKRVPNK